MCTKSAECKKKRFGTPTCMQRLAPEGNALGWCLSGQRIRLTNGVATLKSLFRWGTARITLSGPPLKRRYMHFSLVLNSLFLFTVLIEDSRLFYIIFRHYAVLAIDLIIFLSGKYGLATQNTAQALTTITTSSASYFILQSINVVL